MSMSIKVLMGVVMLMMLNNANAGANVAPTTPSTVQTAVKLLGSAKAAIAQAQTIPVLKDKIDFLAAQAQGFLGQKNYQEAVNVAQFILTKLDANSIQAKSVMDQAKSQIAQAAQGAMGNMMGKLGAFGK